MGLIFTNCTSLLSLPDISHLNLEKVENKGYIFSNINEHIKKKYDNLTKYQINNVMTLLYKNNSERKIKLFYNDCIGWNENKDKFILKINNLFFPPTTDYGNDEGKEKSEIVVKLIEKNKISNVSSMFHGCDLVNLLIPEESTFSFNKIDHMFNDCYFLKSFSNIFIYTNNLTDVSGVFYNCKSLEYLPDISCLDTSKVKNMNGLFYGCSSLKSLPDISKWNTENVKNMNSIFRDCSSLISLPDISKWNISKVVKIDYLFYNCSSLKSLPDISKWETNQLESKDHIFGGCKSLISLPDISKLKTKNVGCMLY